MAYTDYLDTVQKVYIGYYQRAADPGGLIYWAAKLDAKAGNLNEIIEAFANSAESTALYGTIDSTNIGDVVDDIYNALFGRVAETAGKAYYVDGFTAGTFTAATIMLNVLNGATGEDLLSVNNKVDAAELFTTTIDPGLDGRDYQATYSGDADAAAGRTFLSTVTWNPITIPTQSETTEFIQTNIADSGDPIGTTTSGQTFTLTTGVDTLTGGSGNDTFTATDLTLTAPDVLVGGSGTDTINYTNFTAAVALPAASLTGIEVLNARAITNAITAGDLSLYSGLTTFNSDRSNAAITVTNLAAGGTFGIIGNASVINNAALGIGYATGATVTAGVINISGGTLGTSAVTLTGANLLSTTINSTGAANVIGAFVDAATSKALTINATTGLTTGTIGNSAARTALTINATGDVVTGAVTSSAATTVAITGAGKVTTDIAAVVAPTITVSGSGAVDLTLGGTVALNNLVATVTSTQTAGSLTAKMGTLVTAKFTGGDGDDVLTTNATLTTGYANGGAGTDTLILGAVAHANTTTQAAKFTNFETLVLNGTFDASLISGITAIGLSGATNAVTGMSATQAANVQAIADIGATTLALTTATGTADVLSLKMGLGTKANAATNSTGLTVAGFETLNINANPGPTAATAGNMLTTIASLTGATLNAVNMTGSAVAITNAATTVAATFDASALTGDSNATIGTAAASIKGLTLGGNLVAGSTVTGSAYIDTITLGTVGSTYNLGAGNDAISGTLAQYRTGSTYNTIDGGAGTDTATISDGGGVALTIVDDDFKALTNVEKVTITSTTTGAQSITTGGWFDANFKTGGATLTTTSTTGNISVTESSFSGTNAVTATSSTGTITISGGTGNQTITATSVGTAAGEGTQTITTLGGNDTVTSVSAVANTTTNVISTGAGNDTIVAGLGKDLITGGTGTDTMTGGGAEDTFAFGTNGSLVSVGLDIITDYSLTADILTFGAGTTMAVDDVTALVAGSNVNTTAGLVSFHASDNTYALKVAAIQADVQLDTAGYVAVFNDSGNAYVYYAGAATGNADDQIIQLTGVVATSLAGGATTIIT